MRTTFWNGLPSSASACCSTASQSSKSYKDRSGYHLDSDQATAREGWDDVNHNLFSILYFTKSGPAFFVVQRFEGKTQEGGVGHGQNAWTALREKFDGCSREALRAAHREMETVKMRSDENPDDFLYKKDRCRDRLDSVAPKEGPSDRQYEDIILQCSTRVSHHPSGTL